MLRQRVLTAIALLALLAVVIGSESLLAFRVTLAVFFAAAVWEGLRLFNVPKPLPVIVLRLLDVNPDTTLILAAVAQLKNILSLGH